MNSSSRRNSNSHTMPLSITTWVSSSYISRAYWCLVLQCGCSGIEEGVTGDVFLCLSPCKPSYLSLSQLSSSCSWCLFCRFSWASSTFRTRWSTSCMLGKEDSLFGYCWYWGGLGIWVGYRHETELKTLVGCKEQNLSHFIEVQSCHGVIFVVYL